MRQITIAVCAVIFFLSAAAQDPNRRMVKPDTSKQNTRTAITNTRVASISRLKTLTRGTVLDNRRQIAVIGIDSNQVRFTDDPKYINLITALLEKQAPSEQHFTPRRPCPDADNCIFYNNTATEISNNFQYWTFERNDVVKNLQVIELMTKMQPGKHYLFTFIVYVESSSPDVFFEVVRIGQGKTVGSSYFLYSGKNQLSYVVEPQGNYNFLIRISLGEPLVGDNKNMEDMINNMTKNMANNLKKYRIYLNLIRVRELEPKDFEGLEFGGEANH